MRPLPGGDALPPARPRSRKSSIADPSASHGSPSSHGPTAFFLKSEEEMEQSLAASQQHEPSAKQRDSTYGVQSLEDTLEAAFGHQSPVPSKANENTESRASQGSPKGPERKTSSTKSSPSKSARKTTSGNTVSNPLTPLNAASPFAVPQSAIPSPPRSVSLQSLRLSDEDPGLDDVASQAIASSSDEAEDTVLDELSSFPQLVMPSIQMPSRRPFTAKGKTMGKLKVLVAGEAGIGKTSLVRSIVQLCDDIVHVDPLSPSSSFSHTPQPRNSSRKRKAEALGTTRITEIHASTKAYPHWWTDLEESRTRRRKSTPDAVLERNICFVDTPGFSTGPSRAEDASQIVDYVESLMYQNSSVTTMEDNDLIGVVGGSGGLLVDVILYLLPAKHDISEDIECMQRLSALSNVIPVIAKSDRLSSSELLAIKTSILTRLQTNSIRPFLFGTALDDALLTIQGIPTVHQSSASTESEPSPDLKQFPFNIPTYPYAVSSTPGPDTETMDASLLMSPDYIQPLLPSELPTLVNQVFDPESISWLRHAAAKKFLAWRRRTKLSGDSFILNSLQQQPFKRGSVSGSSVGLNRGALNASATSSLFSGASPSGVLVPQTGSPFYTSNPQSPFPASSPSLSHTLPDTIDHPTEFSLARYQHIAHGEQRLQEVRLAKWATDLQRSMRNERERYEELQRNERAKWLLERVGEEVASGNITATPGGSPRADWAVVRRGDRTKEAIPSAERYHAAGRMDSRDPLGLCDFSDQVRRKGFVFMKVLGGVSVLGAVVVAVVRTCGWEVGLPEGGAWSWLTGGAE